MNHIRAAGWVCLLAALFTAGASAQAPGGTSSPGAEPESPRAIQVPLGGMAEAHVLRLVKFSGELRDAMGRPRTGVFGVTFALYEQQEGGAARWLETQNIELDALGRYSVLLGVTRSEGLPLELFSAGQARWLGIQVENESEQPRVLLVSVPYALKAADADTLGGRPASAFVLAEGEPAAAGSGATGSSQSPSTVESGQRIVSQIAAVSGTGTINKLTKWTDTAGALGDSAVFESGGKVGVGTTTPSATLHLQGPNAEELGQPNINGAFVVQGAGTFAGSMGTKDDGTPGNQYLWIQSRYIDNPVYRNLVLNPSGGNVGVGVRSPVASLHIQGPNAEELGQATINGALVVQGAGTFAGSMGTKDDGTPGNQYLWIQSRYIDNPVYRNLVLNPGGGNVGIGTTTPTERLEVAGNLKVSGTILNPSGAITVGSGSFSGTSSGSIVSATQAGAGSAGTFWNSSGGMILTGRTGGGGTQVFSLDGSGNIVTNGSITGNSLTASTSVAASIANIASSTTDQILKVTQSGAGSSVVATSTSDVVAALSGSANASSGAGVGLWGNVSTAAGTAVRGSNFSNTGFTMGVEGTVRSPEGIGVRGENISETGETTGVLGRVNSIIGTAGVFDNVDGGKILSGQVDTAEKFSVDGSGNITTKGDVRTTTAGTGIVVKSPNGTICKRIGIDNSGALQVSAITCP